MRTLAAVALMLGSLGAALAAPPPLAPDHVLVRLAPGVSPEVLLPWGTAKLLCQPLHGPLGAATGLDRTYTLDTPPASLLELGFLGGLVEMAEPDPIGGVADDPNDPAFAPFQWTLRNTGSNGSPGGVPGADVHYLEAMARVPGSQVILAIIDTGIEATHPDLAGRVIPGWNLVNNNANTTETNCPHGTHMAGIAGAATNNLVGIAAACPGVQLMPVKVLDGCSTPESTVAAGIVWATDHGASVASMSLQFYGGSATLEAAVQYGHDAGVVLVAAAGNHHPVPGTVAFPGRYAGCMAISATDNRDQFASFSNSGAEIDVSAPGDLVYSTYTTGIYSTLSGTSCSTPHVAATACLIRGAFPELTPDQVIQAIRDGADDLGPPGWDPQFGTGRLNMARALTAACRADCDHQGGLNVADFSCFLQRFSAGDPWANCDGSTGEPVLNVADFSCYLTSFARGCP